MSVCGKPSKQRVTWGANPPEVRLIDSDSNRSYGFENNAHEIDDCDDEVEEIQDEIASNNILGTNQDYQLMCDDDSNHIPK